MKAILEFNLSDRYEENAHKRAISATSAYISINELDNFLRNRLKYSNLTDTEHSLCQEIRDKLHSILEENDVNMNNLE